LRRIFLILASGFFLFSATQANAQIFHKKKKANKSTSAENNAAPDKVLYDRAVDDIKHGRHEVGRLTLQTLINTYPDSEYLAKAKLSIADSFYKEGGTANMTQAIQGYKDFIIFFPFLPEAAYAQHQVAMAHYKQMDKPDRDRTQARAAEEEFQTFLQKYPNDPLAAKAEQHLREVQEVLAEGDYRIGYFYYVKGDRRAAAGRLLTVTSRYPLYSQSDRALFMLGDIFEKSEQKQMASRYYARIVRDYPLSGLVPDAKGRLTSLKAPIPAADPKAVAWMTAEQNAPRPKNSLVKKPLGLLRGGPTGELRAAARSGLPTMTPEADTPGTEILAGGQSRGAVGNSIVATVATGGGSTASGTAENTTGSESAPSGTAATGTSEGSDPNAAAPPAADPNAATTASPAEGAPANGAASDPNANPDAAKTEAAKSGDGQAQDPNANSDSKADPKKESSSKKKKGLRKIVPW
jgi:outer membrane protein assembly factor BamD